MKKGLINVCGALALCFMSIVSCLQKPEAGDIKSEITVPDGAVNYFANTMDFGFEGGAKVLSFKSNLSWSIKIANTQNGEQWLTIDRSSGNSGSNKVTFTAEENNSYEDRSVIVQFITEDTIRTIRINQKRMEAITLTSDIFEVPVDGGDIDVKVNYSTDYEVIIPEDYKDWIHKKPITTRGLESSAITFTIDPSDEYEKREGRIFFKARDEEEVVTIYQAGSSKLVLSQSEYNLTGNEQEFSIDVSSNFEFSMEMPEVDWLKENTSKTRGMSSHTLKFIVTKNEDYGKSRSAKIKFFDKNSKLSESVVVNQASIGAIITLDTLNYSISKEQQDLDIEVMSNFDYNIDFQGATWVKQRKAKTRGITSRLLQLTVEENTDVNTRTANIKLYDKNSSASVEISLMQFSSAPTIIAEKKEYEVDANKQNLDIKVSSNVDYNIDLTGIDWIKDRAAMTRALSTSTIRLSIDKNDSYDSRSAKIFLRDRDGKVYETISITQKAKNGIVIPTKEFTIDEFGGLLTVEINSNVDYKVTINDEWISESSSTRGLTSNVHDFFISLLGDEEDRTGKIIISNESLNFKETITIKQRHTLLFKKKKVNLVLGKEYSLAITNNSDKSLVWSSNKESIATVTISGIVKGENKGEAIITAETIDGKHSATCKVTVDVIEKFINIYNSESIVNIVNNVIQPGSRLSWTIINESTEDIHLDSLMLINSPDAVSDNIMKIDKKISGGTTVSYTTPIENYGMRLPVYCRFYFVYDKKKHTVIAEFKE